MINIFTVDVEEFHHRLCYQKYLSQKIITKDYSSSSIGIRKIMRLLEEYGSTGTFFVLGEVAKKNPVLIKEIHDRGHELASHGFSHRLLNELTPEEFSKELILTEKIVKKITGCKIVGFRAPRFSLTKKTSWAVNILNKRKYIYDSSIYPAYLGYGARAPYRPYRLISQKIYENTSTGIHEFPLLTFPFGKINLPIKLRHSGTFLTSKAIEKINRTGCPATVLIHPWELLPNNFNNRRNLPSNIKNSIREFRVPLDDILRRLLERFKFCSISEYLNSIAHVGVEG